MDRRTAISMLALGVASERISAADAPQSTGGIKFMVLYGHPPTPDEFEKYYLGTHMPLVATMKGARKMEAAKCLPQADGSPPAFYRVFEAWFDSPAHIAAVFGSPEGVKVLEDLKNFTEGTTVTRVVSKL